MKSHFSLPLKTVVLGLLGLGVGLGGLRAGTVAAQAWPDWSGTPLYGEIDLMSGFTPDPYSIDVVAGGTTEVGSLSLGGGCTGFITAEQPDFRVWYQAGSYPLSFFVESDADTTLVINGPGSEWFCNDDFNGANPAVIFTSPASGQYDVWIGVYGQSATHEAVLHVTEYDLTGE